MTLEELRSKAMFQNTIDIWISLCNEKGWDWFNTDGYKDFIKYLKDKSIKIEKFPLCVKESGGMYERGKDKAKFLDELSQQSSDYAAAYTVKLNTGAISAIRSFNIQLN